MSLVFQHSISSIYLLLSIIFSTRVASINKQVITCLTNFFSSLFSEQHLSSPMTSTQRHHSSVQRLLWLHHTFSGNQSCNTTSFFFGGVIIPVAPCLYFRDHSGSIMFPYHDNSDCVMSLFSNSHTSWVIILPIQCLSFL